MLSDKSINVWTNYKKSKIYPKSIIFQLNKPFKPLNDYHFIRFNSIIEYGVKEIACKDLIFAQVVNQIFGHVADYYAVNKPYIKLKNDLVIKEEVKTFQILINTLFVLDLLMVLISVIKILGEKIIYAIRKK